MFNQMVSLLALLVMDIWNTKYETSCYGRKEKLTSTLYQDCKRRIKKTNMHSSIVDSVISRVKPSNCKMKDVIQLFYFCL